MKTESWDCKGCTNVCWMLGSDGKVSKYCRVIYDQPAHRGKKWVTDQKIVCLDYTVDPEAEDRQVRIWQPPKYEWRCEG